MNLINHSVNPAKTSREKMEVSFNIWKQSIEEHEQNMNYLDQLYYDNHLLPRTEAKRELEEFMGLKQDLYNTWKQTKTHGDLRAWLTPKFEGNIKSLQDPIYTRSLE